MRRVEKLSLYLTLLNLVLAIRSTFSLYVVEEGSRNPLKRAIPRRNRGLLNKRPGVLLGGLGAVNPPHAVLHWLLTIAGLVTRIFSPLSRVYQWLKAIPFTGLAVLGWAAVGLRPGIHTSKGFVAAAGYRQRAGAGR